MLKQGSSRSIMLFLRSRLFLRVQPSRSFHPSLARWNQSRTHSCPVCSAPLPSPLPACTKCWNLFALPQDLTHHGLFGLSYDPNPFVIDLPQLKRKFIQAQAVCHPDAWASKNPEKLQVAQALSARVNNAYQTLLHPLARAEYILERNQLPVSENDKVDDIAFMTDIMEAREVIEDSRSLDEIEDIIDKNNQSISETIKELEAFVLGKDWDAVKASAVRLRYLEGIQRAAKR